MAFTSAGPCVSEPRCLFACRHHRKKSSDQCREGQSENGRSFSWARRWCRWIVSVAVWVCLFMKCSAFQVFFGQLMRFSVFQCFSSWTADAYRAGFGCGWHYHWHRGPGIFAYFFLSFCCWHLLFIITAVWFLSQGLLGGVDQVDTAAFESVWNNIKDKYVSEVSKYQSDKQETHTDHSLDLACMLLAVP